MRRPKQGAAGILANHHADTQRGLQDTCDTTLLATVPGRSGVTSAVAFYGRETGTGLNARDSLVRSNSAEDLLAAAAAGPRGFVGGGVSKGARGRELFPSDRVP